MGARAGRRRALHGERVAPAGAGDEVLGRTLHVRTHTALLPTIGLDPCGPSEVNKRLIVGSSRCMRTVESTASTQQPSRESTGVPLPAMTTCAAGLGSDSAARAKGVALMLSVE